MIFLTIGTQLPFDRLVRAVDTIALEVDEPIFGQIGVSAVRPKNFEWVESLTPLDFNSKFLGSRIVVAHAGIGTILAGQAMQKSLVLMARRASFREHRNDHQLATITQMKAIPGIYEAESKDELRVLLSSPMLERMEKRASASRIALIDGLKRIID